MKLHRVQDFSWEVLLVDNNSTDNTIGLAKRIWKGDAELRIVHEERQGTGYAKLRGMQEARYFYIGIVDQDNWLDEDWMQKAVHYMDQAPNAAFIFGKGAPILKLINLIGSTATNRILQWVLSIPQMVLFWIQTASFMLLAVFYEKKRSIN